MTAYKETEDHTKHCPVETLNSIIPIRLILTSASVPSFSKVAASFILSFNRKDKLLAGAALLMLVCEAFNSLPRRITGCYLHPEGGGVFILRCSGEELRCCYISKCKLLHATSHMNGLEDGIFMSLLARQEDIAIRWFILSFNRTEKLAASAALLMLDCEAFNSFLGSQTTGTRSRKKAQGMKVPKCVKGQLLKRITECYLHLQVKEFIVLRCSGEELRCCCSSNCKLLHGTCKINCLEDGIFMSLLLGKEDIRFVGVDLSRMEKLAATTALLPSFVKLLILFEVQKCVTGQLLKRITGCYPHPEARGYGRSWVQICGFGFAPHHDEDAQSAANEQCNDDDMLARAVVAVINSQRNRRRVPQPMHDSILTDSMRMEEILNGHDDVIQGMISMKSSTFRHSQETTSRWFFRVLKVICALKDEFIRPPDYTAV
ncbi:hypothetical protein TIFTF001_038318 [Ficus carica]|uniref:Uncharacterized protein n=1 Tax=Ficus carica TaxID=3494 RepID=A0AA88EIC0_FICCA|nr:hypothetical protein TIFTF001_038301 [Ficus carica]GMN69255.1 hypothetical protein TIFTF001_038309 [Ficus carica]GMN69263.1 hypothetical protein TIFTF001_038310 [Ficus carica]GMN69264.1 hypothetical protein TIFTF001_038318 [Ficus carica]